MSTRAAYPLEIPEERRDLPLILTDRDWTDAHACQVVIADLAAAANYRTENHEWRWERAARRYFGQVPQKYWEGSNIKRSAVSTMTLYENVEALIPKITQAMFADEDWFEATAVGSTPPEAARVSRETIMAQLHQCRIKRTVRLAARSGVINGNGITRLSWYHNVVQRKKFRVVYDPVMETLTDPFTGEVMQVPGKGFTRRVVEEMIEEIENRPIYSIIPITAFYIDQNCPNTDPQDAQYTIVETMMPIGELAELREAKEPGFNIPDDDELMQLAMSKPMSQGDQVQQDIAASREEDKSPIIDQSADPYMARVKVHQYKTNFREVWVVNQKITIKNARNEYGRKMQYGQFYTELLDNFYGMSMADVINSEQLIQEGLVNGRLDEIALGIHPQTRVSSAGGQQAAAYTFRPRPGGVTFHKNAKEDLIRDYPDNITQTVPQEVMASEIRTQKKTGLSEFAVLGVGGVANPGARSATGAGIQGQAAASRIQGQVENIVDEVVEPMLADIHMLNEFHLDPDQRIEAVDGSEIDPELIFGAKVRYTSRAASKMQSRIALLQILPLIMQNAMNPMLMEQLAAQGNTVDFTEIFQMLLDATGYRKKATWIRKMSPQEQQAYQQRRMAPEMIKAKMQDDRMEDMKEIQDNKSTMEIIREAIKAQIQNDGRRKEIGDGSQRRNGERE